MPLATDRWVHALETGLRWVLLFLFHTSPAGGSTSYGQLLHVVSPRTELQETVDRSRFRNGDRKSYCCSRSSFNRDKRLGAIHECPLSRSRAPRAPEFVRGWGDRCIVYGPVIYKIYAHPRKPEMDHVGLLQSRQAIHSWGSRMGFPSFQS